MTQSRIIKNLKQVRKEAHAMLDNIEAVRGKRHAGLVLSLLHASAATEVMAVVLAHSNLDDAAKEAVADAICTSVHSLMTTMADVGGISGDELVEATQDADAISSSSTSLARQALEAGRNGQDFGGPTPH